MTLLATRSAAQIVVGVSDARISSDPAAVLVTYSLGSCIAVALYDAEVGIAGLLHFQLPASSADPAKAGERPLMFADTGMEHLLRSMEAHGAARRRLKVKLAGGAEVSDGGRYFNIGRRNYTGVRKFLWQQGMLIDSELVGGSAPRTMFFHVADGTVVVKTGHERTTL